MPTNAFLNGHQRSVGRRGRAIQIQGLDEHMTLIESLQKETSDSINESVKNLKANNLNLTSENSQLSKRNTELIAALVDSQNETKLCLESFSTHSKDFYLKMKVMQGSVCESISDSRDAMLDATKSFKELVELQKSINEELFDRLNNHNLAQGKFISSFTTNIKLYAMIATTLFIFSLCIHYFIPHP